MRFVDQLAERISAAGNHLCLGIDPYFGCQIAKANSKVLSDVCLAAIDEFAALGGTSVKFQSAFFEQFGADGISTLRDAIAFTRQRRMLTILDVKRGDISTTMHAYGIAAFDYFGADSITVLPYMGLAVVDALSPWLNQGKGVYVVWVSSNPEGWAVQENIHLPLLRSLISWQAKNNLEGSIGLVLGATSLNLLSEDVLAECARLPLLLPGFGAQQATMGERCKQLLGPKSLSLFPVARGMLNWSDLLNEETRVLDVTRSQIRSSWLTYNPLFQQ